MTTKQAEEYLRILRMERRDQYRLVKTPRI